MTEKTTIDADQQLWESPEREGFDGPMLPSSRPIGMGRILALASAVIGMIVLAVIGGMTLLATIGVNTWNQSERAEASAQFVNEWLENQRMGRDGKEFWSATSHVEPVRLYAVRSWEIVDTDVFGFDVTVRIASSNKAGIQIVKLWTVRVEDIDTNPKIYSVKETISE